MSAETRENIQDKILQSRRLLQQVTDPTTAQSLKAYLEELERRLVDITRAEPPN